MHAHVSYLSEDSPVCLFMLTVERDIFFKLSEARQKIVNVRKIILLCTLSINIKRFPFHIHLYLGIRKDWKWEKGGGPCQKSNYQTWSQRNWNSRNKTLHVQVKEHCTIPFRTGLVRNETRGIIKITKYLFYNEITLTFPYKTMQVNVL